MLQHPVPQKLLKQLGDMTVSFAMLESQMQTLLGSLIREHQTVGQILASQLSFAKLRATVVSLYLDRHGDDGDFKTLRKLLNRAGKIEDERNRLTHSVWGAGNTPDDITQMKITCRERRGYHFESQQWDEARFVAFNESIKRLAFEFLQFWTQLLQKGKAINNPGAKLW